MRGRTLLAGMLVSLAAAGVARARETTEGSALQASETIVWDLSGGVVPMVDCSDGRPDDDCLSGRLGSDQVTQTCNGIATLLGAGTCSTHCHVGYYACGKCGIGGCASCTCRQNFTCNPHAP